jgi:thioredoxin-dependent peroxiredoxin
MATKKAAKTTRKPGPRKTAAKKTRTATRKQAASKKAPARAPALQERFGLMSLGGQPATIVGADVKVGQTAPAFSAQVGAWAGMELWQDVAPLAATAGKVRILAPVPSLDTNTCNIETRRFNEEAAALSDDIVIITISADLPPAQKRWCGAAGVERVRVVSDHMAMAFGERYGTLMKERRWLRRAVFVVDRDDRIVYADYMPKTSDEPNYAAVLEAARQALGTNGQSTLRSASGDK